MTREQFIAEIYTLQEPLRRFLLGMCHGDVFTADDIAQETLLKAYLLLTLRYIPRALIVQHMAVPYRIRLLLRPYRQKNL